MKRLTAALLILALTLSLGIWAGCSTDRESDAKQVSKRSQLISVIESFNKSTNFRYGWGLKSNSVDDAAEAPESGSSDYSKTNVQTEGVDEGDTVKTDGEYIYKLQANGLAIVRVQNGTLQKIAEINAENYIPVELYVSGNTLVMIGGVYKTYSYRGRTGIEPMMDCMWYGYNDTDIRIYDISDKTAPSLVRQVTVNGNYNTSRLKDGKLFYVLNYYFYYGTQESYIPKIYDSKSGGEAAEIPVGDIYYYDDIPSYSYMMLGSIDLGGESSVLKAYLGIYGEIYVSQNFLYTASYDYSSTYSIILGYYNQVKGSCAKTRIVKFSLDDLSQKASAKIDGTIKDRYSLDEYNSYLRVATTVNIVGDWTVNTDGVNLNLYNNVSVLDGNLKTVGKCEKVALGETIYSVRFKGESGSLVTFRQIDPYFKIDLSDPANPQVSKGLKEEGVSQYIHYLGDTKLTIGAGRDTQTINTNWGTQVSWKGLKVSLYDMAGEDPVNLSTHTLGDYVYTELFYNPKALLYDYEYGLFAFPVQMWSYNIQNGYYTAESLRQGVVVYAFDIAAKTLTYRGMISEIGKTELSDWNNYYNAYYNFISRCLRIGNYLYTVSENGISSYNFSTLEKVNSLQLVKAEDIYKVN